MDLTVWWEPQSNPSDRCEMPAVSVAGEQSRWPVEVTLEGTHLARSARRKGIMMAMCKATGRDRKALGTQLSPGVEEGQSQQGKDTRKSNKRVLGETVLRELSHRAGMGEETWKMRLKTKVEMRSVRPLWPIQKLVGLTWSLCLKISARKTILMSNPALQ